MNWIPIKNFENYCINENGEVLNKTTGKIKKTFVNVRSGHLTVDLWKDNKSYKKTIHRLLAETFIPNETNKPCVDHKDGNRLNNSIENLRWATYSENNSRFNTVGVRSEKIKVTRFKEERKKRGGGHLQWLGIEEELFFDSVESTSKYFGCNISNISQMLKKGEIGKRGITRGYKFEYLNK